MFAEKGIEDCGGKGPSRALLDRRDVEAEAFPNQTPSCGQHGIGRDRTDCVRAKERWEPGPAG